MSFQKLLIFWDVLTGVIIARNYIEPEYIVRNDIERVDIYNIYSNNKESLKFCVQPAMQNPSDDLIWEVLLTSPSKWHVPLGI